MWRQFTRKHCIDEELLAHLDGELPILKEYWVRRHLHLCWECRKQLHDLGEQTRVISQALGDDAIAGFGGAKRARDTFHAWRDQFERELVPAHGAPLGRRYSSIRVGVFAVSAAAAIAFGVWSLSQEPTPTPSDLMQRTATAERALLQSRSVVHQTFRVRIRETAPEVQERMGEIEVWSDTEGSRYASSWRDSEGQLRHAVWRPGTGEHLVYNPAVAPVVRAMHSDAGQETLSLADWSQFKLNPTEFETGIMKWLETRQWQPVTFGPTFEAFAREDGAVMRGERTDAGLCLEVERVFSNGVRMLVTLEFGEVMETPQVQRIRFEAEDRVLEVELTADRCEFISADAPMPAVFKPSGALLAHEQPVFAPAPRIAAPVIDPAPFSQAELHAIAMEVHYALHGARFCLGEPVKVIQEYDGVAVEVVTETAERKEELLLALAGIEGVKLRIQSIEEALAQASEGMDVIDGNELEMQESPLAPTVLSSPTHLPVAEQLGRFFADHPEGDLNTAARIAKFTTQAMSMSQDALSHAWALRRLAERYGDEAVTDLPPRSQWLLRVMVRDHVIALDGDTRQARVFFDPLLRDATELELAPRPSLMLLGGPLSPDWSRRSLALFRSTSEMHALIRTLVAGTEPPEREEQPLDEEGSPEAGRVRDLALTFSRLEAEISGFQTTGLAASQEEQPSLWIIKDPPPLL